MDLTDDIIIEVNKRVAKCYGADIANDVTIITMQLCKAGRLSPATQEDLMRYSLVCARHAAYVKHTYTETSSDFADFTSPISYMESWLDAKNKLARLGGLTGKSRLKLIRLLRYNDDKVHNGEQRVKVSRQRIEQNRRELKEEIEKFEAWQRAPMVKKW